MTFLDLIFMTVRAHTWALSKWQVPPVQRCPLSCKASSPIHIWGGFGLCPITRIHSTATSGDVQDFSLLHHLCFEEAHRYLWSVPGRHHSSTCSPLSRLLCSWSLLAIWASQAKTQSCGMCIDPLVWTHFQGEGISITTNTWCPMHFRRAEKRSLLSPPLETQN